MRRQIITEARQISTEVRAVESINDQALAGGARLLASILDARQRVGAPAQLVRKPVEQIAQAIALGAQARSALLDAHGELASLNLRELAFGDVVECPENGFGGLRLVESDQRPHSA